MSVPLPAGQSNCIDLLAPLEVAGASLLGITVMRTIVKLQVQNWAAVTDDMLFGLVVGRKTDVGINIAGQPAASNNELDWLYNTELYPSTNGAAVNASLVYEFDVRSKRKMQELNQAYLLCMSNQSAAAKTYEPFVRTLIALP